MTESMKRTYLPESAPSTANFDGPRLKLQRAQHHLADLRSHLTEFSESDPYAVIIQDNHETKQREWRMRVRSDPPPLLSAISGDVVHNLRAALDHLMGQLVIANGEQPGTKTEFPVGRSKDHYAAIRAQKTKGVSDAVLKVLDNLNPYKGGNDALWRIHQLDIVDKHRLVLTVSASSSGVVLNPATKLREMLPEANFPDMPLKLLGAETTLITDGATVFGAPLGDKSHDDVRIPIDICLAEPAVVDMEPIVHTLEELVAFVQDTIIRFEPLISHQP